MTAFHQDTSIPTTILRLFNAVGRRETNPHVVPHIFESLRHSDAIPLGNLAPRRDYIDTRDVAEAFLAVLAHGRGCEVLNVGTGVACSVTDIVESLQRILERNIQIVSEPLRARASERMVLIADVEKIERVTGWRARIPLDDTLRDLVELYGLRTGADARV
jgi:nucleoside-diphosphate-sugar epimerase